MSEQKITDRVCMDCVRSLEEFLKFKNKCLKVYEIVKKLQMLNIDRNLLMDIKKELLSKGDGDPYVTMTVRLNSNEVVEKETILKAQLTSSEEGYEEFECLVDFAPDNLSAEDKRDVGTKVLKNQTQIKKLKKQTVDEIRSMVACTSSSDIVIKSDLNQTIIRIEPFNGENNKYNCVECDLDLVDLAALEQHIVSDHPSLIPSFRCKCSKSFFTVQYLAEHVTQCFSIEQHANCKRCGQCKRYFNESVEDHICQYHLYECKVCGWLLSDKLQLFDHKRKEHKQIKLPVKICCENCGKILSRKKYEKHIEIHQEKKYNCQYCVMSFEHVARLRQHLRSVHIDKDIKSALAAISTQIRRQRKFKSALTTKVFTCRFCKVQFDNMSALRLHSIKVHDEDRKREVPSVHCQICNRPFLTATYLRGHMLSFHNQVRPFPCQYCEKKFKQRRELILHTRIHTKEKPYVCEVCGEAFRIFSYKREHFNKRHNPNKETFSCELCTRTFDRKYNLKKHLMNMHYSSNGTETEVS